MDRIAALELCLGDAIPVPGSEPREWTRVVGLALDGGSVVVTGAEDAVTVRLRPDAAIPVVRAAALPADLADEVAFDERMFGWYAGDVAAAGAAVAGHAADLRTVAARQDPTPGHGLQRGADLVGIYGGDLDHVVDALGGRDDAQARAARAQAAQRSTAAARPAAPVDDDDSDDDAVEAAERVTGAFG